MATVQQHVGFMHLVFHPHRLKKVYTSDGHVQVDVVEYRKLYLHKLETTHAPPPHCSDYTMRVCREEDESKNKLVIIISLKRRTGRAVGRGRETAESGARSWRNGE